MSFDWRQVWERKGKLETNDLREINGYEHTTVDIRQVASQLASALAISPSDSALEVGCGAGFLAQHIDCAYVGVDYSGAMAQRHRALLGNAVVQANANRLPFRDGAFDIAFSFSVFQYFPDASYARAALEEMMRVASRGVFVGDLPIVSHRDEHLLFKPEWFEAWETTQGFYNSDRFNVLLRRERYGDALSEFPTPLHEGVR